MTEWVKRFGNMTLGEMKETEAKKKKIPGPQPHSGLLGGIDRASQRVCHFQRVLAGRCRVGNGCVTPVYIAGGEA